jgi:hypothetical protein
MLSNKKNCSSNKKNPYIWMDAVMTEYKRLSDLKRTQVYLAQGTGG